ncbi:MAG: hypothetical protein ACYC96_04085 [Fimbriimonadaceae bacterium]
MDSIDRIAPIAPINPTVTLRVAEAHKDGGQKPGGDSSGGQEPRDVLELHSDGADDVTETQEETRDEPSVGLDLAV